MAWKGRVIGQEGGDGNSSNNNLYWTLARVDNSHSPSQPLSVEGAIGVPILQLGNQGSAEQRSWPMVTQLIQDYRAHSYHCLSPPAPGRHLSANPALWVSEGMQVCVHAWECGCAQRRSTVRIACVSQLLVLDKRNTQASTMINSRQHIVTRQIVWHWPWCLRDCLGKRALKKGREGEAVQFGDAQWRPQTRLLGLKSHLFHHSATWFASKLLSLSVPTSSSVKWEYCNNSTYLSKLF